MRTSNAVPTPRPWLRDTVSGLNCDIRAENGRTVALTRLHMNTKAKTASGRAAQEAEDRANADLIVRCVSAHDDLLAQLREAREYVQAQRDCLADCHRNPASGKLHPSDVCAEDDKLLARIDAVIAKATGAAS